MSCPFPSNQLSNLKLFIDLCKKNPSILHQPDLEFFKNYIESLGGKLPDAPPQPETKPEPKITPEEPVPDVAPESEESDVELDLTGVIEPDSEDPQPMGDTAKEVSEEEVEQSNEKKIQAIEAFSNGNFEDAVANYTSAILFNPGSALLYAKRGQCFLMLKKPNACIRDCNRAIEINSDCASAYKYRGRAHRLLGNWLKSAEDLRTACKLDFDEQADEWLKEVTPNAAKLETHQRKYERKRLEKEVQASRERVKRMREQHENVRKAQEGAGGGHGAEETTPADFMNIMNDPEIIEAFKDPEVEAAFEDITANPANILKYHTNPKISALMKKFSSKLGGAGGGLGGLGGLGNLGAAFGGAGFPQAPPTTQPKTTLDDTDLD